MGRDMENIANALRHDDRHATTSRHVEKGIIKSLLGTNRRSSCSCLDIYTCKELLIAHEILETNHHPKIRTPWNSPVVNHFHELSI